MRSATSFFNKTLFRNQVQRTWPLWLGYTALWLFILPVTLLTKGSSYQERFTAADAADFLLNTGARGGIFMAFGFGLLFAMLSFSYLTKSRATNGYHALPVRRETLFSTAYLTGLFCQCASILLAFLLGAAVASPFRLSFTSVTGAAMLSAMLETVFYYSFAVLCVMMTGQMLAAPAFYVIGSFLAVAMESLVRSFAGNFLFGYASGGTVQLGFLSPLYWMLRRVDVSWSENGSVHSLSPGTMPLLAAYAAAGHVAPGLHVAAHIGAGDIAARADIALHGAAALAHHIKATADADGGALIDEPQLSVAARHRRLIGEQCVAAV